MVPEFLRAISMPAPTRATGNKITVEGMSLDRIENGLVVEGFDGWDNVGFRRQLGLKVE